MVVLACGFTLISFNLIQIQLVQHAQYTRMAITNHMDRVTIPAKRGSLLDADGSILAQTQRVYNVHLDGLELSKEDSRTIVPLLAQALDVPPDSITWSPGNRYQLIASDVEDAVKLRLDALKTSLETRKDNPLKFDCLIIEERDRRVYPNNELGAHVLGFTGDNGHGLAGMEKQMDSVLQGVPGERLVERDAKRREIALYQVHDTPAIDGDDVTLTIKMAIQHVVEGQLDEIVQTYQPEAAYIIIMDPQTGEIMAMGSRPTYDPNDRASFTRDKVRNRCVTDPVEPGSVFKIITLAGALNEGSLSLNTPIFCENGDFFYAGKHLHDDNEHFGLLPVEEVMAKSSNIGFAKIALNYLGKQKLYDYAAAFGMRQRPGLFDHQGETRGWLAPTETWSALSITRVPMGQEVLASPMQLATAMCVIANGGKLMAPMLVRQVTDPTGKVVQTFQPRVVRQVVSATAARDVAEALHQVTVDGTAKAIKITDPTGAGYSFAGKTGTAQKWITGEGYSHTQHVSSFIGFMPAQNPAFVALVMIDDPKTAARQDYGAEVSAPVFAKIGAQLAQILNIPPDIPAPAVPPQVATASNPPHGQL